MAGNKAGVRLSRRAVLVAAGGALGAGALAVINSRTAAQDQVGKDPSPDFGGKTPVAFLMDNGATMIDFAGPWEVFQDDGGFYLFSVAPSAGEFQTTGNFLNGRMTGLRFRPD